MWNWNYTNVNNEFFKEWTPELAYVIGFFIADGSLSNYYKSGKKNVVFSNKTEDRDVIEKIANVCGYKNKVLNFKNGMSRIVFAGDFIYNFFVDLGFTNSKTFSVEIPEKLLNLKELHPHLIRGIFDGDGSIQVRKRRIHLYPQCNIVGTEMVIDFIAKVFEFYNSVGPHKSIYRINFNGKNAVKFFNYIYKNSTIHMDRKYKLFEKIKDWKTTCERWSDEDKLFLIENYNSMYAKDISKILNKSFSSVTSCAKRLELNRYYSNGKIKEL